MRHERLLGRKVADRFTIKRFLGEGGMATVYVAEQDEEPRQIALKIMNEELTADRTFVRRFQREAQAASRVQHPNSVQIIDYGVQGGLSYIAMELVLGDDLYVLLEREGAIAEARAVRILIEVCEALMLAHELGIVHRDLKPENIMVVADQSRPNGERVKVLDFGIAKLLVNDELTEAQGADSEPPSAVTRAGTFMGTPAYMSPEQCNLLPIDTRADIYTCGVLLFQLITGRLPFEGQTPLHTATLHIHQEPPRPSSYAPGIDLRLEALILKTLAKKPADRHPTARHLAESMKKLLPELSDMPVAAGPVSGRPPPAWKQSSSGAPSSRPQDQTAPDAPSASTQASVEDEDSESDMLTLDGRDTPTPETPTRVREAALARSDGQARRKPSAQENEPSEDSSRTLIRASLPNAQPSLGDETTQRFGVQESAGGDPRRQVLPTLRSVETAPPSDPTNRIETAGPASVDVDLSDTMRPDEVAASRRLPPRARVDPSKAPSGRSMTPVASDLDWSAGSAAPPFGLPRSSSRAPAGPMSTPAPMFGPGPAASHSSASLSAPTLKTLTPVPRPPPAAAIQGGSAWPFFTLFGTTLLSALALLGYYFGVLFPR